LSLQHTGGSATRENNEKVPANGRKEWKNAFVRVRENYNNIRSGARRNDTVDRITLYTLVYGTIPSRFCLVRLRTHMCIKRRETDDDVRVRKNYEIQPYVCVCVYGVLTLPSFEKKYASDDGFFFRFFVVLFRSRPVQRLSRSPFPHRARTCHLEDTSLSLSLSLSLSVFLVAQPETHNLRTISYTFSFYDIFYVRYLGTKSIRASIRRRRRRLFTRVGQRVMTITLCRRD